MAEIIKFGARRKERAKAQKEITAQNNRVKYGRTKQQKTIDKAKVERANKLLDEHKLSD